LKPLIAPADSLPQKALITSVPASRVEAQHLEAIIEKP
jgi:hypothetical protein